MNLTNYKNYQETQFDNCQNCSPNLDHNLHFLFYLDTFLCSKGVAGVLLESRWFSEILNRPTALSWLSTLALVIPRHSLCESSLHSTIWCRPTALSWVSSLSGLFASYEWIAIHGSSLSFLGKAIGTIETRSSVPDSTHRGFSKRLYFTKAIPSRNVVLIDEATPSFRCIAFLFPDKTKSRIPCK